MAICLLGISFIYNYEDIIFKRPQSVHKWRQADCASIALNYYQGGMNFFVPENHNLTADNGTTGKTCTSEIPILYYAVAVLYKVFGYHDYIYRILNTLIFLTGLLFLFKLLHYLLKDLFWAVSLSLLFFTSPILVYYGNNFLSNSSALAFSIIGLYYIIRFFREGDKKFFNKSMLLFLFAGAFKITALFCFITIVVIMFLEWLKIIRFDTSDKLFPKPKSFLWQIISVLAIIGSWIIYATCFNKVHDTTYFSTTLFPLWDMNFAQIKDVLKEIKILWLPEYFHLSVIIFFILAFAYMFFFFRKNDKKLIACIILVFFLCIAYVLMQFWTFSAHDYYTIEMYIFPMLVTAGAFDLMKKSHPKVFFSPVSKIIFTGFLLFNIYYCHARIDARYDGWMNDYPKNKDLYTITPYLRQIGISEKDTVISIPDIGPSSLYLMNQKGWTEYIDEHYNNGQRTFYNNDSAGIQTSIDKGAKYLILNGLDQLYTKKYLQPFCTHLLGRYNNVLIFDLKNKTANFDPNNRVIKEHFTCNAENVSSDKQFFIGEPDSLTFKNGNTQSSEFSHDGKYSCKLGASNPYGMTYTISNLSFGETITITAWRKINNNSSGGIIVSSVTPDLYYNSENTILEKDEQGWEKISVDLFVSTELDKQDIGIYLYNPEADAVFFDDLEIYRYENILKFPEGK
jgi:hypothetical protein